MEYKVTFLVQAINKRVSNEHKRASNFILNSVDYQICRSFKDRMFIMVCGFVTLDDKTERKFSVPRYLFYN